MTPTTLPLQPRSRRFRFARSVGALILREMASTYGRSPGGYLWAVVEPIAAIAVMSFVFSLVLRAPSLGTNFAFFYATGYLPFMMYMTISQQMAASIRFSRPLLEYPAVTFLDALVARFLLNALTHLLVFGLVIWGLIIFYELNPIINWSALFSSFCMIMAIAVAVGILNCYLMSRFQVWERVWAVVNRPMFVVSAVLFIPENLSERYRELLMINPIAHGVSEMRRAFYATYDGVSISALYVYMISLAIAVTGMFLLYNFHKEILSR